MVEVVLLLVVREVVVVVLVLVVRVVADKEFGTNFTRSHDLGKNVTPKLCVN